MTNSVISRILDAPLLCGQTPNAEREELYGRFREGSLKTLVVSKVANFSVDLPDANVAIQVSGTFGSRQEEAQRLGRILRPKPQGESATFYSLVQRTRKTRFSQKRQLFHRTGLQVHYLGGTVFHGLKRGGKVMRLVEALLSSSVESSIAAFYGFLEPTGALSDKALKRKLPTSPPLGAGKPNSRDERPNPEEMLALRLITLAAGGSGVVIEQCHQKLNQLSRKWRRNGAKVIEALISRGLVFVRREGYRHIYFVPEDLREVLSGFFLNDIYKTTFVDLQRFTLRNHGILRTPPPPDSLPVLCQKERG